MKRIFQNLLPAFRTVYYVVLEESLSTGQRLRYGLRLPGPQACIPGFHYLRVRYLNLFGLSLFQKVERLDLTQ